MERPDNYESITKLYIAYEKLTELPFWVSECKNLEYLNCSWNKIKDLNNLPIRLKELDCNGNNIRQLDNLPCTLTFIGR